MSGKDVVYVPPKEGRTPTLAVSFWQASSEAEAQRLCDWLNKDLKLCSDAKPVTLGEAGKLSGES
jgi:hypothetical protein